MKSKKRILIVIALIGFVIINSCKKKEMVPSPVAEKYFPRVKAIIQSSCLSCHASTGYFTGRPVAFDTDSQISESYASIKAAVADPVTPMNRRMPQVGSLSSSDIDVIVKWFNKGGKLTD